MHRILDCYLHLIGLRPSVQPSIQKKGLRCPLSVNLSLNLISPPAPGARFCQFALALLLVAASLAGKVSGAETSDQQKLPKLDPRSQQFFAAKERHARSLARELKLEVAPEIWDFFDAGVKGNWSSVRELWHELSDRSGQYSRGTMDESVRTVVWSPVLEAELAYECFTAMDIQFVEMFARGTIDSIPRDSIYFGGTDPGRGVITAFCKSHADADPFFVLTQNALADGMYLKYLQATFGKRISVPREDDSKNAFEQYKSDAEDRMERGKLKPGEQVSRKGGRLQFSGQVSVMTINGLLAKTIFEGNPTREFYIEESFPLDWMYPHLSPHGLIMKINRQPLAQISDAVLQKDREYWRKQTARFLGDWITEETPLKTLCEFIERVYLDDDLEGFKGDPLYVSADRAYSPRRLYSKLRQAHAGVYAWRLERAGTSTEKDSMKRAAELAFKQTLTLCPEESENARLFAAFLREQNRLADARLVLETGLKLSPRSRRLRELADELKAN